MTGTETKRRMEEKRTRRRYLTAGAIGAVFLCCRFARQVNWLLPGVAALLAAWKLLRRESRLRPLALGAAAALLWLGVYQTAVIAPAHALCGEEAAEYTAVVQRDPVAGEWSDTVVVNLRGGGLFPVRAKLAFPEGCISLRPGDEIMVSAVIERPERYLLYASSGIFVTGRKAELLAVNRPERLPLRFWPQAAGKWMRGRVKELFGEEESALMLALLTGDQEELTDPLADQLSRTGLRHIAAVSGLHVGFLMTLALVLPGEVRGKSLFAAGVLLFFCLMTGAQPSVVRATVMGLCGLLAPFFRREKDSWASLRLALLLLLLHNPFAVTGVGLQLSFGAVAGILLCYQPLYAWMTRGARNAKDGWRKRFLLRQRSALAVSLSALVFTLPISACCFEVISILGPLVNLAAGWLVGFLFMGGILAVLASLVLPPLAWVIAIPVRLALGLFEWIVAFFSYLPFCAVTTQTHLYALWLAAVYVVGLLLWRRKGLGRRGILYGAGSLAALAFLVCLNRALLLAGGLAAEAVDVGQGQSVLFLSENDAAAVDCGGWEAGNALADAMGDVGVYQLELLALTHYDSDHMNGVEQLLERVTVKRLLLPDTEGSGRDTVTALAAQYDIPIEWVTEDAAFSLGEAELTVYAPVGAEESNNTGLALRAECGDFSVLVTGDMDSETELLLAREKALPPTDVLVVGHHGSKNSTSEEFLQRIQPDIALISAGEGNRYGHPSPETLKRLRSASCAIRRTDRSGTVTAAAPAANP